MDQNDVRRCPDCGALLVVREDGVFACSQDETLWMVYGPKLLLRAPVVKPLRLALDLPWEVRKAA